MIVVLFFPEILFEPFSPQTLNPRRKNRRGLRACLVAGVDFAVWPRVRMWASPTGQDVGIFRNRGRYLERQGDLISDQGNNRDQYMAHRVCQFTYKVPDPPSRDPKPQMGTTREVWGPH